MTPDTFLLCSLLDNIKDKWNEIGIALRVQEDVLGGLRRRGDSDTVKLFEVINSWITTESKPPITWETVISAIRRPEVNNIRRAKEIKEYLIAHHTVDN